MKEQKTETNERRLILLALAGLVLVGLLGMAVLLTGRVLAQGEPQLTREPEVRQAVERIITGGNGIVITSESGPGLGFPFEDALRGLVQMGALSQESADSIMSDLSSRTDAVTYSSELSPDGQMREIRVDVDIRSDDDTLRPAMEQTLDNAVANGLLTAEQAAEILAMVDAAPDPTVLALPGDIVSFEAGDQWLTGRLDTAVAAGTISQAEAETFRDILARLLAPIE